jgi:competence protein CoiA
MRELPAARLEGTIEGGFVATLDSRSSTQTLPVAEFLCAAFSKRLKFGIVIGAPANLELRTGATDCWRCHREIQIITRFDLKVGPHSFEFSVPDLTDYPGIHGTIARHIGPFRPLSAVKIRPSKTQGRKYLSNGCSYCNALFGEFYEIEAREQERVSKRFATTIDERWLRLIRDCDHDMDGWAIF